jgi:hypothetical protein
MRFTIASIALAAGVASAADYGYGYPPALNTTSSVETPAYTPSSTPGYAPSSTPDVPVYVTKTVSGALINSSS